jgi:starvation-inducible outer membrane lipoprotein
MPSPVSTLPALACALLTGCIVVPAAIDTYDADCQLMARHLVLQPVQIAAIQHCSNQGCIALIVAGAATAAATAIVSGSVVIVGNAASWIERRANCVPPPAPPA